MMVWLHWVSSAKSLAGDPSIPLPANTTSPREALMFSRHQAIPLLVTTKTGDE
ncbi:rCG53852 [Rattus norvegicus]|uniref:RCG53852 n=1 Tax=Rattus norvegicus TaxID=10116 RepID=A6JB66_RAT|nr:rCG53852 [Rattus norvegicus]